MQFKKRVVSSAPCVVDGGVCPDSGAGHSQLVGLAQGGPLPSKVGGGHRQVGIFLLPWLPLISGFCVTTWAQEPARSREALPWVCASGGRMWQGAQPPLGPRAGLRAGPASAPEPGHPILAPSSDSAKPGSPPPIAPSRSRASC